MDVKVLPLPNAGQQLEPTNAELRMSGRFSLTMQHALPPPAVHRADAQCGLLSFAIDVGLANTLADFVVQSRSKNDYLEIKGREYVGYDRYEVVDGALDGFEQARATSVIQRMFGGLSHALKHCKPLENVVQQVLVALDTDQSRIKQLHILRQRSRQATFGWHQDHLDLKLSRSMITVVVLLRGSGSGMQVWGFHVHKYNGVGACAAFPGAATHRSVTLARSEEEVIKLVFFLD